MLVKHFLERTVFGFYLLGPPPPPPPKKNLKRPRPYKKIIGKKLQFFTLFLIFFFKSLDLVNLTVLWLVSIHALKFLHMWWWWGCHKLRPVLMHTTLGCTASEGALICGKGRVQGAKQVSFSRKGIKMRGQELWKG